MKIGIITQPLENNYGGLLQNFALQQILKSMGHDVITIDQSSIHLTRYRMIVSNIKTLMLRLVGRGKNRKFYVRGILKYKQICKQYSVISKYNKQFIDRYIEKSHKINTLKASREFVINNGINALIVGSDQVWRPSYNARISHSYLDFAKGVNVRKIAYAASFGVDYWEYNEEETIKCRSLVHLFDAISVRESTAVELCRDYLGIDAVLVLDPTLLLDKHEYVKLIDQEGVACSEGDLMTYILDKSEKKSKIITEVSQKLGLSPFSVMPRSADLDKELDKCVFPGVLKWLRGFLDAKFVICDSFHGAVFSIIFNKPFLIIGNKERGMSRFHSLLSIFDLESRLIVDDSDLSIVNNTIDWDAVNEKMVGLKSYSISYLKRGLESI